MGCATHTLQMCADSSVLFRTHSSWNDDDITLYYVVFYNSSPERRPSPSWGALGHAPVSDVALTVT